LRLATAPAGSPVAREQLLASARGLFAAMVTTGLAHASDRTAQRLFTLSVSATALLLPRLARLVRSVAGDIGLTLARHAAADPARLFARVCTADALCRALLAAGEPPSTATRFGRVLPEGRAEPDGTVTCRIRPHPGPPASGWAGGGTAQVR
jgi:hypothetical protein